MDGIEYIDKQIEKSLSRIAAEQEKIETLKSLRETVLRKENKTNPIVLSNKKSCDYQEFLSYIKHISDCQILIISLCNCECRIFNQEKFLIYGESQSIMAIKLCKETLLKLLESYTGLKYNPRKVQARVF